jgi:hypothetical protein
VYTIHHADFCGKYEAGGFTAIGGKGRKFITSFDSFIVCVGGC